MLRFHFLLGLLGLFVRRASSFHRPFRPTESLSPKTASRPHAHLCPCRSRAQIILSSSSPSTPPDSASEEERARAMSRPPIIPFDFARDDIVLPVVKQQLQKNGENTGVTSPITTSTVQSNRKIIADEDSARPSGYDNEDHDDDDDSWVPTLADDSPTIIKFLKDTYIGSELDSPKRKQARYVIRNITGLSFAIGLVFTIVWYAFPGKFISYRGDLDSTAAQIYSAKSFMNPNDLLSEDLMRSETILFEDTKELDFEPTSPRIELTPSPGYPTNVNKEVDL